VKYLYCPRCKELRVKSWYQIRDKCQLCFSDSTAIKIPNTWMTYVLYVTYIVAPALVLLSVAWDDRRYLYSGIAVTAIMIVFSWLELGRGLAYSKTKIKVTSADSDGFRKKGWH